MKIQISKKDIEKILIILLRSDDRYGHMRLVDIGPLITQWEEEGEIKLHLESFDK